MFKKYKTNYYILQDQLATTERNIRTYLHLLCEKYPDTVVDMKEDIEIKAKSISDQQYINKLEIEDVFKYLEIIEEKNNL